MSDKFKLDDFSNIVRTCNELMLLPVINLGTGGVSNIPMQEKQARLVCDALNGKASTPEQLDAERQEIIDKINNVKESISMKNPLLIIELHSIIKSIEAKR